MLRVRDIVNKNKVPRRINLQPNVLLEAGKTDPQYRGYEESFEGVIQSYVDRYPDAFLTDIFKEWAKDVHIMRRIDRDFQNHTLSTINFCTLCSSGG